MVLVFVLIGIFGRGAAENILDKTPEPEKKGSESPKNPAPLAEIQIKEPEIKESAQIVVPYTVQAPFANWAVHEESCEEAALLMYHYFLEGKTSFGGSSIITPQTAANEIVAMKNWQIKNYGREPDLSIEQLGIFAEQYYGYNFKAFKNITKEDIKKEISAGRPVMVPVITHALQNPHYGRNPTYHILVIKGYRPDGVITNDAGVKEGENYFYTWNILFSAIDAQTPKMGQGREMVILTKD